MQCGLAEITLFIIARVVLSYEFFKEEDREHL